MFGKKICYFNNKFWQDITREERVFCAELFYNIRNNKTPFLKLLGLNLEKHFDIGFEVCFYRDLLKENDIQISKIKLPIKRTFDLVLFSDDEIHIIEAKSQQGFSKKQLKIFNDKKNIRKLFILLNRLKNANYKIPSVYLYSIKSSNYNPKKETMDYFDKCFTWNEIYKIYTSNIYRRADEIYKK